MNSRRLISLILPVYQEEEGIIEFHQELRLQTDMLKEFEFEFVYVNDGSTDTSGKLLKKLAKDDCRITVINFSRNFGHQIAVTCGLDHSRGDAVISMDTDLQHPPQVIPELISKWQEGYDIVYTVRKGVGETGLVKRITAKFFYKLINLLTRTNIRENAADYRLLSKEVVRIFKNDVKERIRFLRGLISWVGFKSVGVEFEVQPRLKGKSKYNLKKMLEFAVAGITSFSTVPIKIFFFAGLLLMVVSIAYGTYSIVIGFIHKTIVPGWTTLLVFLMFFSSIQFLGLGLLGFYIANIFEEVKKRPLYIIKSIIKHKG